MKQLALMVCLMFGAAIWSGCRPLSAWITLDRHSDIARPTFCLHKRSTKTEHRHRIAKPLYIREISVHRFGNRKNIITPS